MAKTWSWSFARGRSVVPVVLVGVALLLPLSLGGTPAGEPASSGPSGQPPGASAQGTEPVEIWWNQEWARLIGMQGSWKVEALDTHVVLRPEGKNCTLEVFARLTGGLHSYEFQETGEVVLAHGWIMIAQAAACQLSGEVAGQLSTGGGWGRYGFSRKPFVESVELRGLEQWELKLPSNETELSVLVHRYVSEKETTALTVTMISGDIEERSGRAGERFLVLRVVQYGAAGTPEEESRLVMTEH